MFAEFPAMVAPQDDDGVVAQTKAIQFVEHLADLRVGIADRGVIAVLQLPGERVRHGAFLRRARISAQLIAVGERVGGRVFRVIRIGRQLDGCRIVKVPIFLRRNKRQVGLREADRQEERLGFFADVAQRAHRDIGHHAVFEEVVLDGGGLKGRSILPFRLVLVLHFVGLQGCVGGRFGSLPRRRPGLWIVIAGMINLADSLHKVAVVFEMLRQSDDIG